MTVDMTKRSNTYYAFTRWCLLLSVLFDSCQKENHVVFYHNDYEIGIDTELVDWRRDQNRWIFDKLKWSYFLTDSIRDSSYYDFSIDPLDFFNSIKASNDRFSFATINDDYRPDKTKAYSIKKTISLDTIYVINGIKIGYFIYNEFESEADVTDVVLSFQKNGINELIVDLRNNSGGLVNTCIYLSSLIVPIQHLGKLFCTYKYNSYLSEYNMEQYGSPDIKSYFKEDIITKNRNLGLYRVLFLIGNRSASASELIINCLRPYMTVVTIGETTTGKDVGMMPISSSRYKYTLYPITFRTYNAFNDSVPMTGLEPDYFVEDSQKIMLGQIDEPLLSRALEYIKTNKYE